MRPQNHCKDCGYTWYPRGKSLSNKCPNCASRNVGLSPFGGAVLGGCLLVVLVFCGVGAVVGIFGGSKKQQQAPEVAQQALPVQPAPPPPPPIRVGDTVSLTNATGYVPLATTPDIYRVFRQANESARIDHYRREEVVTVPVPPSIPEPATAVILEVVGDLFKVRILDGYHKDKVGFIHRQDAQRR